MQKTKLAVLLKAFSKKEMKDFEKFISSSYFSSGRNTKPLFNAIKKYYPSFDSVNFTEEKIFKKLYPHKKFEGKKSLHILRVLFSDITLLAEKYLKYVNLNTGVNKHFSDISYLSMLNTRKLDSHFMKYFKDAEKSIGYVVDQDSSFFLLFMQRERKLCEYMLSRERQQETSGIMLKQCEYLLSYFLAEYFKIRAHYRTNELVYNADFNNTLLKEIMESFDFEKVMNYMKNNSIQSYPVLAVYYYSMMAQIKIEEDVYYENFKHLLKENFNHFDRVEKINLLTDLEASCWKRVNSNLPLDKHVYYRKQLIEIHKKKLKESLYKSFNMEYMNIHTFRNILIAALNVKDYQWMEKFTEKYYKELPPEYSENMYNYSMAILNFSKGNFEKSLSLMSNVKYHYFYLRIDVKNWMLQIHYELNHLEQAYSLIDSYRHFLSKNKTVSDLFKKLNADFLNCYVKLMKIKHGDRNLNLDSIKREVNGASKFIHKGWVLKKIAELENISGS